MLTQVAFKNFKALEDVSIDLERLTVLVGANATGKTSVLEGIHALCEAVRPARSTPNFDRKQHISNFFSGRLAPEHCATRTGEIDASLSVAAPFPVELLIGRSPGRMTLYVNDLSRKGETIDVLADKSFGERMLERWLNRKQFPSATRVQFDLNKLTEPSFASSDPHHLTPSGFGLASEIAEMLLNRSPALEQIQADLRKIVPLARRLRAPSTTIVRQEHEILTVNGRELVSPVQRTYRGHRLELELEGSGFVPAEALSEGTLLVLGMLTLLHASPSLHVFLLDDIDRGLHPEAQRLVVEALRRFVEEHHDVQVICTSHSPYALDHFRPEEVRVMKADARGRAHCRKLTEHPDWDYWKDSMKPGEFWSSVGEGWVYEEEKDAG